MISNIYEQILILPQQFTSTFNPPEVLPANSCSSPNVLATKSTFKEEEIPAKRGAAPLDCILTRSLPATTATTSEETSDGTSSQAVNNNKKSTRFIHAIAWAGVTAGLASLLKLLQVLRNSEKNKTKTHASTLRRSGVVPKSRLRGQRNADKSRHTADQVS